MRKCNRCGEEKALAMFTISRGRPTFCCRGCSVDKEREWRDANRQRYRSRCRVEQVENALGRVVDALKTRARLKGATVIENVAPIVVLEHDDGVCGICGEDVDPFEFDVDHVIAVRDGGTHTYGNVQVAHHGCNSRKGVAEKTARTRMA